jgi:hypothetical protein
MDNTKYTYSGPDSALALAAAEAGAAPHEVLLRHGAEVALPADNAAVKTLVAMGHLSPVADKAAPSAAPAAASAAATATAAGAVGSGKTNPKA